MYFSDSVFVYYYQKKRKKMRWDSAIFLELFEHERKLFKLKKYFTLQIFLF